MKTDYSFTSYSHNEIIEAIEEYRKKHNMPLYKLSYIVGYSENMYAQILRGKARFSERSFNIFSEAFAPKLLDKKTITPMTEPNLFDNTELTVLGELENIVNECKSKESESFDRGWNAALEMVLEEIALLKPAEIEKLKLAFADIKLPTDEEIEQVAKGYDNSMSSMAESFWMPQGFKEGAKWMRKKIKTNISQIK